MSAPATTTCENCGSLGQWRYWAGVGFYVCAVCDAPAPWVRGRAESLRETRDLAAKAGVLEAFSGLRQFVWQSREQGQSSEDRAKADGWLDVLQKASALPLTGEE